MSEKTMSRRQALFTVAGAAAATAAMTAAPAHAEFQPAMQTALASLKDARQSLMWATADKGGHRVMALALINQAIQQVHLGIHWDNVH
jgi:hypothetical protein